MCVYIDIHVCMYTYIYIYICFICYVLIFRYGSPEKPVRKLSHANGRGGWSPSASFVFAPAGRFICEPLASPSSSLPSSPTLAPSSLSPRRSQARSLFGLVTR